jgi:hypothetical protein
MATTFFGQPLVAFIRLRDECAKELARFQENDFEVRRMPEEWWHDRRAAYRKCNVDLIGFAASNQTFVFLARQAWLGTFRIDPKRAGEEFEHLSLVRPPGGEQPFKSIIGNLRLKF